MSSNYIISTLNNGVRTIQLNRPKTLNAINNDMFFEITNILKTDANNDAVVLTILTGAGNYFSSGRDFAQKKDDKVESNEKKNVFSNFIIALIDYPKLLITVVNGPAYGVAVTALALADVVYASDRASFITPFVKMGLTPEGCSTYTFQRILGRSKASEMILLGEKMTAKEAEERGLVAKVIPHEELDNFTKQLHKFGQLPLNTVMNAKKLLLEPIKSKLHEAHAREYPQLVASFKSPEFLKIQSSILKKRSKL